MKKLLLLASHLLALALGGVEHAAIDEHRPAWKSKSVDVARIHHVE